MANKGYTIKKIKGRPPEADIQLGAPTGIIPKEYSHEKEWVAMVKRGALTREEASLPTPVTPRVGAKSAADRGYQVGDRVGYGDEERDKSRAKKSGAYISMAKNIKEREEEDRFRKMGEWSDQSSDVISAPTPKTGISEAEKNEAVGRNIMRVGAAAAAGYTLKGMYNRRKAKITAQQPAPAAPVQTAAPAPAAPSHPATSGLGLREKRAEVRRKVAAGPPQFTGERRGGLRRGQDLQEFETYKKSINAPSGYTYSQALGKPASSAPAAPPSTTPAQAAAQVGTVPKAVVKRAAPAASTTPAVPPKRGRGRPPKAATPQSTTLVNPPKPAPVPSSEKVAPSKGSRVATVEEVDAALANPKISKTHRKVLENAKRQLQQQKQSAVEEANRKATGKRLPSVDSPSAPQAGSNTPAKRMESPTHGGIDHNVAETKGSKALPSAPADWNAVKARAASKYANEVKVAGGQKQYEQSVQKAQAEAVAKKNAEAGVTATVKKSSTKGLPTATTPARAIDAPIPVKEKALDLERQPSGVASKSTPPNKIPDSENEVIQKIRDKEADVAIVRRGKGLPPATPSATVEGAPVPPAQSGGERARAILRKRGAKLPVVAPPKGQPLAVTTAPAPTEASIPEKQKAAELAAAKAEMKAGRGSGPGRQKVPMPRTPEQEAELNKPGAVLARREKEAALPSQKQQIPSSHDEIIKELRDQEASNATVPLKESKSRGEAITAPVAGKPPDKSTAEVGVSQALSKSNAAETAKRKAQIESHMKKKGFTKVSAEPESGEVKVETVAPKARVKKSKPANTGRMPSPAHEAITPGSFGHAPETSNPNIRTIAQANAESAASKGLPQTILETPAAGEVGAAMKKAAARKSLGGKGTLAGIGVLGALSAAESAINAPKGQKFTAAKEDVTQQAKYGLGAALLTKAVPAVAPALVGAGVVGTSLDTGFKLGAAAHAAAGIFSARKEAAQEKAVSEAKYGTVEKATATRKSLSEQAKRRKPMNLDQAGSLMDKWRK